jgi:hypothetical protein
MALAGSYLDLDGFAARTIAPANLVDGSFIDPTGLFTDSDLVARRTAWVTFVESRLVINTTRINARLRKRYAAPFADPVAEIVLGWLADMTTPELYKRRGWDPSDAQADAILADAARVLEELKEAADSADGLFDLPLRQDKQGTTGVVRGGPFVYSEPGPYDWMDVQLGKVQR